LSRVAAVVDGNVDVSLLFFDGARLADGVVGVELALRRRRPIVVCWYRRSVEIRVDLVNFFTVQKVVTSNRINVLELCLHSIDIKCGMHQTSALLCVDGVSPA